MHELAAQVVNGIQLGSIYALIALGYTMVYGVLKLINFAHGDIYMVGAYTGLGAIFVLEKLKVHANSAPEAILVLIITMIVCGALGFFIEQAAYRPLRSRAWLAPSIFLGGAFGYISWQVAADANRNPASCAVIACVVGVSIALLLRKTQRNRSARVSPRLTALITAIGMSLFLENFGVLPQIFGSDQRYILFSLPSNYRLAGVPVDLPTVMIFIVSFALMGLLTFVVTRTKIGKAIRAVSFDADAAALMGINTDRVTSITFALGAALAGAAGVMVTGVTGTGFTPYVGLMPGVKAFIAAVLGGIGSIPGALIGGLIMGLAETMVVAYGSNIGIPSTYRDAVAFFILIVILLVRPSGILGKYTPEKV